MTVLDEIVTGHSILIACGTGGVGKTTVAAAIAIEAAQRGRNACGVTIDPAEVLVFAAPEA